MQVLIGMMQKNGLNNLKRNRMATAVEWYQKAIFEILKEKENLSDEIFLQNILNAHLQAKEMEKQEKRAEYMRGWKDGLSCKSINNKMK